MIIDFEFLVRPPGRQNLGRFYFLKRIRLRRPMRLTDRRAVISLVL
jgi:hypothetical protein